MSNENKNTEKPCTIDRVITSAKAPTMEKYGWHRQCGFDDEPTGWLYEGGEEAYYEALAKWEESL